MKLYRIFLALPLLILFAGCGEPKADLSKPKSHRSGDVGFDYPGNWKITDDIVSPAVQLILVESPGDALVILQSFPTNDAEELSAFANAFSMSATDEMPAGKVEHSTFEDMPESNGYEWIVEEFEISFLGETVPHRRLYGSKELGERQVFLIFQVATEDLTRAEPGFELIWKSLRSISETEEVAGEQAGDEQAEGEQAATRSESE